MKRRLRRLLGLGWSADEFLRRYRQGRADAWGYVGNADHEARAIRILAALPDWPVADLLELGCAEGFLTRRFLERGVAVTACDLSAEAIERARSWCGNNARVQFHVGDIRSQLPGGTFDVCLLSDVLYYLSPAEIRKLSNQLSSRLRPRRRLIFANEWNANYRDLTHPKQALEALIADGVLVDAGPGAAG
ncbi:MAG: class I SAM-dependent methyltransferase, partial [Planctomycetaceae bacterium]